ncbi:putative transcriptional regulator [Luteibacter sp. Sphag1AF]|uniref:hypothetical protein n=1 Tax=Luteibacter sp. Sphag1AF TaxID=2587031 RepID=UPI00161254E0|nr:hypothetical protein [Luteibacter sp. Sphag1AF]MBB3228062.1 putative transcriptional regulator [Luteibacter sp. Sphag1AF]
MRGLALFGFPVRAIADAITQHLAAQPKSADTVEGVQQWWLRPRGIDVSLSAVTEALLLLEHEQVVTRRVCGAREVWRAMR